MPRESRNIEIKARIRDFNGIKERVEIQADIPCQVIPQEDTYFECPNGRLKLRVISPDRSQLIFYDRPDSPGPKRSEYHICEFEDLTALKNILALAYGVRGVVRKIRHLYLIGQTRVHLDKVLELDDGWFLELEVVLSSDQSDEQGITIAKNLMEELGVHENDLLEGSYMELIESQIL